MSESASASANDLQVQIPEPRTQQQGVPADRLPTRSELRREKPRLSAPPRPTREPATPARTAERRMSFQPHIVERPLGRFGFGALVRARAGQGVVIATAKNGTKKVDLDRPPTFIELIGSGGGTLYEVDMGLHHTTIRFDLPADDDLLMFHAEADLEWRVVHAGKVVHDRLVDIRETLRPILRSRLSKLTRLRDADDTSGAEEAIAANLDGFNAGTAYGLDVRIVVHLEPDQARAQHTATRRELLRRKELESLRYENEVLRDAHEHRMLDVRLAKYKEIIKGEDFDRFALQLARNPSDVPAVVQLLRDTKNEERRLFTDFLKHLFNEGAIDRWEIDDHVRSALAWLNDSTKRIIEHTDGGPATPLPDAPAEEIPKQPEASSDADL